MERTEAKKTKSQRVAPPGMFRARGALLLPSIIARVGPALAHSLAVCMSEALALSPPAVCAVRVALDPATALRCCAALLDGRSSEHLSLLFQGTDWANAVLTLCASLDQVRFAHRDVPVRLNLRLSDDLDLDSNLEVKVTFPAIPSRPEVHTPPQKATGQDDEPGTGSSNDSSSGSSHEAVLRGPHTI